MQKWTAFLFAFVALATVALIVVERPGAGGPAPKATAEGAPDGGASPGAVAAGDAGSRGGDAGDLDGGSGEESPESALGTSDAGATLLDGAAPPSLTGEAPKSVVFGVILVQYKGAQGAPPTARPRDAALELAKQLAADAKTDFKAALAKGDKGSMENAGRMPRGMLEPAPEYVVFSLPKDGVSDPVDTPRGFWIIHRIE
jgi:parvulin-like peptidyl-prolyl isomerase